MPSDLGIGSVIGGVASSLVAKVMGGVILVLILFAGVQTWRLSSARAEAREAREQVGAVEQALKTSNDSIDTLEAEIHKMNQEALSRAADYERSKKLAAQEAKRFEREREALAGKVDRIAGLAKVSGCKADPDLLRELKGL